MNRRFNLLLVIPIATALVAYFVTGQLIYTAAAFVAGYILVSGLRFLLLPPHLHQAARRYQRGDLAGAQDLVKKAIAARPNRWEPHYLEALIRFSNSELDLAQQSARKALALHDEEASAHLVLGQILYAQGHYDEARNAFADALHHGGKDSIYQYHAAATAYRLGDCSEAIPRLELALRLGVENAQLELLATYYLAECLQKTGEGEQANVRYEALSQFSDELENLRRDLQLVPDYPERIALSEDIRDIARYVEGRT